MSDFNRYQTANELINKAAVECGLVAVADPFTSTDPSFLQLTQLLNSCGQEMITAYDWQQLRREEVEVITYGSTGIIALPDDYDRMLDQTSWNRTDLMAAGGPLNPQEWQQIQGSNITLQPQKVTFRLDQDSIKITPTPPAVGTNPYATLAYEYISRAWVLSGVTYRDYVSAVGDTVLYDPLMMIKFLKMRFLGAKGFDTSDIAAQMDMAFKAATSKNTPGQVLSLSRSRLSGDAQFAYPRTLG